MDFYRDGKLNTSVQEIGTDVIGANVHRSTADRPSMRVGTWSAGCQVFQDGPSLWYLLMLCDRAAAIRGNSFAYTLLKGNDL